MTSSFKFSCTVTAILLLAAPAFADTLELVDGSLIEGRFVGGTGTSIMFEAGGEVVSYETTEIVALWFSAGTETALAAVDAPAPSEVTVAAGTRLMIRMSDILNSQRHRAGHRFRGQLVGALVVNGVEVAPNGAWVYGQITQARQSGRVAGSSELAVTFTDIKIGNQLVPISTTGLIAETGGTARQTVGRTARGAAIGGLIGGGSGARTGAAVGAGASILTSGATINVPAGTLVETNLAAPLVVAM
jgi:hypothetical protein